MRSKLFVGVYIVLFGVFVIVLRCGGQILWGCFRFLCLLWLSTGWFLSLVMLVGFCVWFAWLLFACGVLVLFVVGCLLADLLWFGVYWL